MRIFIKKFGTTLVSRSAGKEGLLAYQPVLKTLKKHETLEIDFEGVMALGPSWGDEFLTPLFAKFGNRIKLFNTENSSVQATLELLDGIGLGE